MGINISSSINLGRWTLDEFEGMIAKATQIQSTGRRVEYISRQFLGVSYRGKTLIGDDKTPERFVVDLSGVDCFTFIDYVEALCFADSFLSFQESLICTRYRSGIVTFDHRNHFFTDWIVANRTYIEEVTKKVGGRYTMFSKKILNLKENGAFYVPCIKPVERTIDYIPAKSIENIVLKNCRTGDYIGIYADNPGLDVTHVGIFVRKKSTPHFRHASPVQGKVIDQEFEGYMVDKPGFLVLRPRRVQTTSRKE